MDINQEQIDDLVHNPAESLNIEIKRWIGLTDPEHQAKIVKGCLALRNRNGGSFVVGFDDKTLQPDTSGAPANPRDDFHVDNVQGLISRYSHELFEVGVAFSSRDGVEYPVIVVPPGVRVPVAAKRGLPDSSGSKQLLKKGDVYFRTLSSNGTPSTSVAQPEDWREILDICFDNREADIGRFFRRHLSGADRTALIEALQSFGVAGFVTQPPSASLREKAMAFLETGETSFRTALAKRSLDPASAAIVDALSWQIALVVQPELNLREPDADFLREVLASNPRYTGWPVWLDSRGSGNIENQPVRTEDAWQALIAAPGGSSRHLDFWRFEPTRFYLRRVLQDDVSGQVPPGTALDPILVILRVAEAIAVGLGIVRTLAADDTSERSLGFAFKWTKLANRELSPWANPMVMMMGSSRSHVDEITTFVEVPSDAPFNALAPYVSEATRRLFAIFDGEKVPDNVVEQWTQKLLNRQL
ncbi:hypothetical protein J2X48_000920 [Bosea sp. BE271]|uniref:hypothetical protein n=1 Tax=Bosea TaxID=85413 RepID=UPI002858EF7D|nr:MULTISPECIES: hypothetical protein [Bosea]MDR6827202.1 hypothetical protein [Bosea robiniae]MDR6893912.1 hypothetical protein [Bosea sp. BE109]MDR7137307.1 hypothetical protein [Bosea sp. BE168]MDR7174007.1 hypothetical protein [Bosea sp. BE271]